MRGGYHTGSWKLEAGHYFMQRKYKVCCNRLLAIGCWPVFTTAAKRQFFTPVGVNYVNVGSDNDYDRDHDGHHGRHHRYQAWSLPVASSLKPSSGFRPTVCS